MAEPKFSGVTDIDPDDDLPRTLRREREAQARRQRTCCAAVIVAAPSVRRAARTIGGIFFGLVMIWSPKKSLPLGREKSVIILPLTLRHMCKTKGK